MSTGSDNSRDVCTASLMTPQGSRLNSARYAHIQQKARHGALAKHRELGLPTTMLRFWRRRSVVEA